MADILTFTPNPALDVLTRIARVNPTHKMRCEATLKHPGGGGVNPANWMSALIESGCAPGVSLVEMGPPEQIFGAPENPRTAEFLRRVIAAGRL